MIRILMVGAGGFAGSICRYIISDMSYRFFSTPYFPYGTLTVNTVGCLLIGLLGGLVETRPIFSPEIQTFIIIGFLGGFTTFSTFGYEIFTFARQGLFIQAFINLFVHLFLGFGAVWLGFSMSKLI